MPTRFVASSLVVIALTASASAQTTRVIPSQFATTESPGIEQEPLAFNRVRSVQYVDRTLLTTVPNGASITRLAYRRDTNGYTNANMARTGRGTPNPVWRVRLGNTAEPALNPSATFPTPFAAGWTTVYTPKTTAFPATAIPPGGGPANFDIQFIFDVPFVYTGGNLGIEHYCFESNGATFNYFVDAIATQPGAGTVQLLTPQSLGCPLGENRAAGFAPNPGGSLQLVLYGAPVSTLAFACLAFDDTTWGQYQLPLDLSLFGLPGCWLFVDPLSSDLVQVDSGGAAEYALTIPAAGSYANLDLLAQWAVLDDRVNPAVPLAASDALRFTLGPTPGGNPIPMSFVSATGNLANSQTGYVWPGRGCVFRLSY